ncbi:MAG: hypothetical protein HOE90_04930 [Bacteriovoracaceae bacterium]|jgi:hypothetical protein|nr:hypothetical protein [Bacteriovoracaceae bacterium]
MNLASKTFLIFSLLMLSTVVIAKDCSENDPYQNCSEEVTEIDFENDLTINANRVEPNIPFVFERKKSNFPCDEFKKSRRSKLSRKWYQCMEKEYGLTPPGFVDSCSDFYWQVGLKKYHKRKNKILVPTFMVATVGASLPVLFPIAAPIGVAAGILGSVNYTKENSYEFVAALLDSSWSISNGQSLYRDNRYNEDGQYRNRIQSELRQISKSRKMYYTYINRLDYIDGRRPNSFSNKSKSRRASYLEKVYKKLVKKGYTGTRLEVANMITSLDKEAKFCSNNSLMRKKEFINYLYGKLRP